MAKSVTVGAISIWESLVAIRKRAIDKLIKTLPGATLLDVEVKKIEISPANARRDIEECEIFLSMGLQFYLKSVRLKQIDELMRTGSIKLLNKAKDERWLNIEYTTSYNFKLDEETGEVLEGSFSNCALEY